MNRFQSINSVKLIGIQVCSWLKMALQELIQIILRLKIDFWNLIQINSQLKKLHKFWFKSTHDSKVIQCWFESRHDSMMLFAASILWPFLGIQIYCWLGMTFLGSPLKCWLCMIFFGALDSSVFLTNWLKSAHDSTSISETRISSTHELTAFQKLTQNQLLTQVDSPGIESDWLMTQSASPFFDTNQLMTQAKSIWLWVDSCLHSEPYPCLLLSSGGSAARLWWDRFVFNL